MTAERHRQFVAKRDISGPLVYISSLATPGRNLRLEDLHSRAVLRREIHELITTVENAKPGDGVRDVGYIGFFEVLRGGSLRVGDVLRIREVPLGSILGFDLTHFPNHLNVVVRTDECHTGASLNLNLEDEVRISAS